jgi:ribonuclease E
VHTSTFDQPQREATPEATSRPAAPEALETVASAPVATAFNLPPLPPIHAPADIEEGSSGEAPSAAQHFRDVVVEPAPAALAADEPVAEPPVEPVAASPSDVPSPTLPAHEPAPGEAQAVRPAQGDLLSHATDRPAEPLPETGNETPPGSDTQPPKDAAQG